MRKSKNILIPAVAFSAILPIAACQKDPTKIYQTTQACAVSNDQQPCQDAYERAVLKWRQLPGYTTEADCELGAGVPCTERPDGTYIEPMVGFTLNSDEVTYRSVPNSDCTANDQQSGQPACQDNSSTSVAGHYAYYANGSFMRPASSASSGVLDETQARAQAAGSSDDDDDADRSTSYGGFGDEADAHGGFGGE